MEISALTSETPGGEAAGTTKGLQQLWAPPKWVLVGSGVRAFEAMQGECLGLLTPE